MLSEAWLGTGAESTQTTSGLEASLAETRPCGNELSEQAMVDGWRRQSLKGLWASPCCSFSMARSSPFISCSGW